MKIAIDISQIAHEGTGVSRYVRNMVRELIHVDNTHEYVLFGASFRKCPVFRVFYDTLPKKKRVTLVTVRIPPSVLQVLWNVLHIVPVEHIIGHVDVFWSSDWIQPPLKHAKGITTIHDVMIYTAPESFPRSIIAVQKRRLKRAKKVCTAFLCDSEATKADVHRLLHIQKQKLFVVYPGFRM